MDAFDTHCWPFTLGAEKGFQNMPNDPGNWTGGRVGVGVQKGTKFGISAASYPNEDIANLTVERAKILARRDYYDKYQCAQMPAYAALLVFDTAYHGGKPARWLQGAVGTIVDGVIGAKTIAALRAADRGTVVALFCASRLNFMADIPGDQYDDGWMNRIAALLRRAIS
jgi:lysozyme family protein